MFDICTSNEKNCGAEYKIKNKGSKLSIQTFINHKTITIMSIVLFNIYKVPQTRMQRNVNSPFSHKTIILLFEQRAYNEKSKKQKKH